MGTHPNAGLFYSCTRIRRETGGEGGGLAELHVTSHTPPPTRPGCPTHRDTSLMHVQDVSRTPGHVPYTPGMSHTPGHVPHACTGRVPHTGTRPVHVRDVPHARAHAWCTKRPGRSSQCVCKLQTTPLTFFFTPVHIKSFGPKYILWPKGVPLVMLMEFTMETHVERLKQN